LFLANHPSELFFNQAGMNIPDCKKFVWVLDDPFMMGGEQYAEDEIVLVAEPSFIAGVKKRGARNIGFLPVAAPVDPVCDVKESCRHDVIYVGSLGNVETMRKQLDNDLASYFDGIVQKKLDTPDAHFDDLLRAHPYKETQIIQLNGQLAYYLYAQSNRKQRLNYLQAIDPEYLKIFGPAEWKEALAGTPHINCFEGPVDPFKEYQDLICSAKINLNLRSLQGFRVPTQRDFCVPAYSGFLLSTSHQYEIRESENVAFGLDHFSWSPKAQSPQELNDLIDRYINSPEEREAWIELSREKILSEHTYAHRMEQLGQLIDSEKALT